MAPDPFALVAVEVTLGSVSPGPGPSPDHHDHSGTPVDTVVSQAESPTSTPKAPLTTPEGETEQEDAPAAVTHSKTGPTKATTLQVPCIVDELARFINNDIIEGMFRINGSLKKINYYMANLPKYSKWLKDANIYDVCSLFKKILITNYKFIDVTTLNLVVLAGGEQSYKKDTFNWKYFNEYINTKLSQTGLSIFIYTIHFIANLIQHNSITKMSVMNYAIIFQPIFFTCDNLMVIPHYINLLNFILENRHNLVVDAALQVQPEQLPSADNSSLFYKFRNFKNKSIDSINDFGKRLPYKLSNKSVEFGSPDTSLETIDLEVHDLVSLKEKEEEAKEEEAKEEEATKYKELVIEEESQDVESVVEERKELASTESFYSLDPLETNQYRFKAKRFQFENESPVDPLLVDPVVNEVVQLEDIDTKSFQFNVDDDLRSPTSSVDSSHSHETNDTSFQSNSFQSSDDNLVQEKFVPPAVADKSMRRNSRILSLSRIESRLSLRPNPMEKRKSIINLFRNDNVKRNFTLKLKSKSVY